MVANQVFTYLTRGFWGNRGESGGAIYLPYMVVHHTDWSTQKGMSTLNSMPSQWGGGGGGGGGRLYMFVMLPGHVRINLIHYNSVHKLLGSHNLSNLFKQRTQ